MSANQTIANPYLQLYLNCGINVTGAINKETAQRISSSVAQLHNALGHAINDLVKMLAL